MGAYSHSAATGCKRTPRQKLMLIAFSFFALGAALGVVVRRSEVVPPARVGVRNTQLPSDQTLDVGEAMPNRLQQMANQQAQPLLAQLRSTPRDAEVLAKLGYLYYAAQDFGAAAEYFQRSVDVKDDPIVRTELGRAYYYAGDPGSALAQFEYVLRSDPDNATALFNVGMIKWRDNLDVEGALAAWKKILQKYPNHPRRAEVERLIARAKQHRAIEHEQNTRRPPI